MYSLRRRTGTRETRVTLLAVLAFFFLAGALGGWAVGDTLARRWNDA